MKKKEIDYLGVRLERARLGLQDVICSLVAFETSLSSEFNIPWGKENMPDFDKYLNAFLKDIKEDLAVSLNHIALEVGSVDGEFDHVFKKFIEKQR